MIEDGQTYNDQKKTDKKTNSDQKTLLVYDAIIVCKIMYDAIIVCKIIIKYTWNKIEKRRLSCNGSDNISN